MATFTFTQLGPPNKVLKLSGSTVPFGRPRKGAVLEQEREVNQAITRYPGNSVPDRTIFNDQQSPIVMTGRFMDSRDPTLPVSGRPGTAQSVWDELDDFVADRVMCRFEWDNVLAMTGLITKCKRGIEAYEEQVWSITFDPDVDETKSISAPAAPPKNTSQLAQQVLASLASAQRRIAIIPPDIEYSPGFLTSVANAMANLNELAGSYQTTIIGDIQTQATAATSIMNAAGASSALPLTAGTAIAGAALGAAGTVDNTPAAQLSTLADSVDNADDTTASDVENFRALVANYQTATATLQTALTTGDSDDAIAAAQATSQARWFEARAAAEEELLEILGVLAEMDLIAEIAQKGQPDRTYIACFGDTWESIAITTLGSASYAAAIRDANGARYGTPPSPGQIIHIPQSN